MRRRLPLILPLAGLIALAGTLVTPFPATADPAPDPALAIVDAWDVTGAHTFPGTAILPAQRPSIAEAPNGDLLVTFNTTGDGHPGGQLRVIRSTDDGRTWGPSAVLAEPALYGPSGSIAAQRGIATMADGTMLVPYNDMINHSNYNNRESTLFIARSADSGHTWTGTDTPVALPRPIREAHVAGSPILTLADGTVLLGIWGALELTEDWETDPMPWASGVLRSFDGGATWSDYRTVAFDPHNPVQYPPFHGSRYPSGANEFAMHELPDGRILAVIRYATEIGENPGQSYLSYSSDSGATWSDPVPMSAGMGGVGAEALSLTEATCTDQLSGDTSKLIMGHRVLDAAGTRIGQAAVRVSFDDGVTWGHPVTLQNASGGTSLGAVTGEPTFHRLDDGRILVLFQVFDGGPSRIVANLLEDSGTAADCQAEADAAAAVDEVLLHVERADRDAWPWPLATSAGRYTSLTPLAEVAADASTGTSCDAAEPRLRVRGESAALDLGLTVGQAGLESGDVLVFDDAAATSGPRIGHNALDVAPETRRLYAWNDACDYGLDLDAQARGLGIDLGEFPTPLQSIELVDSDAASRLDDETGTLHGEAGLRNQDVDPATGALEFTYSGSIAVDYRNRSVGLRFPDTVQVQRLRITDRDTTSRLTAGNYSLWASADGVTYEEITGWSLSSEVVAGRLVHTFGGFDATAVAVKISTDYTGTAYSFVLNSFADLEAFGECSGAACAPPPYEVFVSDDNDHFEQVTGWSFDSSIEDGRLVHRIHGLDITARYVKVTQPYTDTGATFHLASLRDDVRLGLTPAPADEADVAPAAGVLSSDNGWDTGLDDGDYTVTTNLWWGENASAYRLYENGILVARGELEAHSPRAQRFAVPIGGRPDGNYTYVAALVNSQGTRLTQPLTVAVTDAGPATPVLSSDNHDGDGAYTVTANLWWGTNATSYRFFENGELVDEGPLLAGTPASQQAAFAATGRAPGRYVYRAEFLNAAGAASSGEEVVTVER